MKRLLPLLVLAVLVAAGCGAQDDRAALERAIAKETDAKLGGTHTVTCVGGGPHYTCLVEGYVNKWTLAVDCSNSGGGVTCIWRPEAGT